MDVDSRAVIKSQAGRVAAGLTFALLVATGAAAQQRPWEIEVYGGAVGRATDEGTRTLPAAGAPLVTSTPIFPSREVPSWFFGDGAVLMNGVAEEFAASSRIAPLDPVFSAAGGGWTGAAGARVRRRLSARVSAEFSADWLGTPESASADFAQTVAAARTSYVATIRDVLATGPFSSVLVDATASATTARPREMAATGALNLEFAPIARLAATPYVTLGGGVLVARGVLPSAELAGRYRFVVLGEVPIDESDSVTLHVERPASPVIVLGGGLRRDLSPHWGLRVDVRALVGPDRTRITIDAAPGNVRGTPAGFVESFTNPAIQFSSDPATGRRSTLSAPPLQGFRVFDGGVQARTALTVALSRRF